MNILFIHQNFPGQFKHLAPALVAAGHTVKALSMRQGGPATLSGVQLVSYRPERGSTPAIHPWLADLETKVIRGEACLRAAQRLAQGGFAPDVIVAHPGWGESLFIKEVWPHARLGIYAEFWYRAQGGDVGFDPEFPVSPIETGCRLRLKNLNHQLHFEMADGALSPTRWQADGFPQGFRERICVAHDGIDTDAVRPFPGIRLNLGGSTSVSREDELVTFVSRNLEPYRGYHIFMRALSRLLALRPRARVLIVGGDGTSYGSPPEGGGTWKERFAAEARQCLAQEHWARVHFMGRLPYDQYLQVLQVSTVHVYLTYPFVLSWSLIEAMSAGCAIVASDTPPVREVIENGETGRLVDFFDVDGLADAVSRMLEDADERARLGSNARRLAVDRFDLRRVCLPRQVDWVLSLGSASPCTNQRA